MPGNPGAPPRLFPRVPPSDIHPPAVAPAPGAAQEDPALAPFLLEDFDGTAYASEVLASRSVQAASSGLAGGIAVLDRALKSEVSAHYDALLAQLGGIGEADRVLDIVRGGVYSLQESMGRVRDEVVVGPASCCPPRHRRTYCPPRHKMTLWTQETRVQNALDEVPCKMWYGPGR